MTTSVADRLQSAPLAEGESPPAVTKAPWWDRPAVFRYGFVALILIVWEIVGPFIQQLPPYLKPYRNPGDVRAAMGVLKEICGQRSPSSSPHPCPSPEGRGKWTSS